MNKKLKPCPFCDEELQILGENHYYAHPVNGCVLQHLCFEVDDKKSIEAWNTRKPIDNIVEQLDELDIEDIYDYTEKKYFEYVALHEAIEIVKGMKVE